MKFGKFYSLIPFRRGLSLMDRYITTELMPPFLFGVGALSSVGVAFGTLFDLVNKVAESGLPLTTAVQVLVLKWPEFASYALPVSVLLATLMTYSRLSSDSELIALRSCGVSVYRLVAPAVVLSLVITGMAFLFNEFIVPAANYQATITLENTLDEETSSPEESNIFYAEYGEVTQPNGEKKQTLRRLFYAEEFDGQRMKDLTVLEWSHQRLNQIVTSESASWNVTQGSWNFFSGTRYLISSEVSYSKIQSFDHQSFQFSKAPLDLVQNARDPYEMNITQALEYIKILQFSGDERRLMMFKVRLQQKVSFPFVCLIFGLVGSALGSRPQRIGKATSFGISIIVIFGYYLLTFIIGGFGIAGILSPFVAAWLPNGIGLGVGGWLLMRTAR